MALINTTPNTPINHPWKEGVTVEVAAVYLIPTQNYNNTTTVQVEFYRLPREGEETSSKMEGYVLNTDGEAGPHNLGEAPTTGDSPTYWEDIHDFAISVLGSNFTKI